MIIIALAIYYYWWFTRSVRKKTCNLYKMAWKYILFYNNCLYIQVNGQSENAIHRVFDKNVSYLVLKF